MTFHYDSQCSILARPDTQKNRLATQKTLCGRVHISYAWGRESLFTITKHKHNSKPILHKLGGLPEGHTPITAGYSAGGGVAAHILCSHRIICSAPCGAGAPLFSLVHLLPHLFPLLLFPFFHWLYLFSSFVHPFFFYQNSPTPFTGRRS